MKCGRWWILMLFTTLASMVASTAIQAQRIALTYSPFIFTTFTDVINLGTGVVETRETRGVSGSPVFTADGRFLLLRFFDAAGTSSFVEIRDLLTGFRTSLPIQFQARRAHPRRLAVYGLTSGNLARLDAEGLRPYAACEGAAASELELTADGSRLLVLCQSGNIESIDEASGMRLSVVVAGATAGTRGFAVSSDGSQALVARGALGAATELALFDVGTATEILVVPMPGSPPPPPFSGPGSGRIVAATPSRDAVVVTNVWFYDPGPGAPTVSYHPTHLLEFSTLTSRRQLAVPLVIGPMAISPDGERAFVASNDIRLFGKIQDLDLRTGQQTAAVDVAITVALGAGFPPLPPTPAPATVSGQRVTLSWNLPAHSPSAVRYIIHAGSRSGASDLGTIDVGFATSFSVASVPPGRYFVRVTAANVTGISVPSTEVIVDVPSGQ